MFVNGPIWCILTLELPELTDYDQISGGEKGLEQQRAYDDHLNLGGLGGTRQGNNLPQQKLLFTQREAST